MLISDVPGDDPSVIASGPDGAPIATTNADALAILEKYRIDAPAAVVEHLRRGEDETPKPGDPRFARVDTRSSRRRNMRSRRRRRSRGRPASRR